MKFMFLTYLDQKAWAALPESERQELMAHVAPHVEQLTAAGKFLEGAPLEPSSAAATVSMRNGKPVITDGPFVETREQVGGYTLIEAENREEAIRIAAGFLGIRGPATIEVRAVVPMDFPKK